MKRNLCFLVLTCLAALSGCNDDDAKPKGEYEHGAFIINEGGFGASNGSVTFLNLDMLETEQNIFHASGSEFAGDVVQSYTVDGDKGYLVINDDNKIEVVNSNTFAPINTITHSDINKPRYIEVIDNKAYISVWGDYDENWSLVDSYVLVYDLTSNAVVKKIDTDEGVENLLYNGKYLFASNFNFGGSNTVAIIDPSTDELVDQVTLDAGPAGMVIDANNDLWVITTGTYNDDGKLFRMNAETFAIEDEILLNVNPGGDLAITSDKKTLIYHSGSDIYKIAIDAASAPTEPFISSGDIIMPYALSLNPVNNDIYMADAIDYSSPGKVFVFSKDAELKKIIATGISPTQVVFK